MGGRRAATVARTFASDAEVLELVARALDVELTPELDGRRLRRLNSAVGRYRLARRAAARGHCTERPTTRAAVARALYGPDVDLNDVLRQMKRTEADLAAAGLLEVTIDETPGGRPRGIRELVLEPPPPAPTAAALVLERRLESRRERLDRRHGPYRRQQSDRKPRGGVPGLWVRRRPGSSSPVEIARAGSGSPSTGLRPLTAARHKNSERDAPAACAPDQRPAALADPQSGQGSTRSSGSQAPRHRWAALSRLRKAGTERGGSDRLRSAAASGAPPCPVAVAIFEARFIADVPGSWAHGLGGPMTAPDLDAQPDANGYAPAGSYRPIGERWAERLERYCSIHDRQTGEPGSGLLSLIDDVLSWRPEDGAPRGARHDEVDLTGGRPTRHVTDPGWPASLAYFIARLGLRARALRRRNQPARAVRSIDWGLDQDRGLVRRPGPNPHQRARDVAAGDRLADWIEARELELEDDDAQERRNDANSGQEDR